MNSMLEQVYRSGPLTPKRVIHGIVRRIRFAEANLRVATNWRGQSPRVYLHHSNPSPIWRTYHTHPPLRYAPYPVAELCHWIGDIPNSLPLPSFGNKGHIVEVEHVLIFEEKYHNRQDRCMRDWHRVFDYGKLINDLIGREECRRVLTFSAGLVEHFKLFVRAELWPKLDYVYPAYSAQDETERAAGEPFTILVIASRFSDKGVPEALRAYKILRERHGPRVQLLLVSQAVPANYRLPEGVIHHNVPLMTEEFKAQVYRVSDVLLIPNYGETAACFPEAYAFGVPVVTTRIHHGGEFVREGVTGYLLETPIFAFSEKFGNDWKTAEAFMDDLEEMRKSGKLDVVVEQTVARLDAMITGKVDVAAMRRAAREFHAECFSPEVRNRKLLNIYEAEAKP